MTTYRQPARQTDRETEIQTGNDTIKNTNAQTKTIQNIHTDKGGGQAGRQSKQTGKQT